MPDFFYGNNFIDIVFIHNYNKSMIVNQTVKYSSLNDPLSAIFAALADPTRRSILSRLSAQEATVNELAEPYHMSLPAISKHLKVLESAGLISRTKRAQWRPCRLEAGALEPAAAWLEEYKQLWINNLDNLDTYLHHVQSNVHIKEK